MALWYGLSQGCLGLSSPQYDTPLFTNPLAYVGQRPALASI